MVTFKSSESDEESCDLSDLISCGGARDTQIHNNKNIIYNNETYILLLVSSLSLSLTIVIITTHFHTYIYM